MSGHADANPRSAFSRPLTVEEVPPEGLDLTISATEPERERLAAQDGLEALAKLEASLHVAPWRAGGLAVTGELRARITQICVVTLDPFESEIIEPIEVKFAPVEALRVPNLVASERAGARNRHRTTAQVVDVPPPKAEGEGEDPPDPIIGGQIDLGALVAEFLALALDPYPRKPGVEFEGPQVPDEEDAADSPFAKLQALKGVLPS